MAEQTVSVSSNPLCDNQLSGSVPVSLVERVGGSDYSSLALVYAGYTRRQTRKNATQIKKALTSRELITPHLINALHFVLKDKGTLIICTASRQQAVTTLKAFAEPSTADLFLSQLPPPYFSYASPSNDYGLRRMTQETLIGGATSPHASPSVRVYLNDTDLEANRISCESETFGSAPAPSERELLAERIKRLKNAVTFQGPSDWTLPQEKQAKQEVITTRIPPLPEVPRYPLRNGPNTSAVAESLKSKKKNWDALESFGKEFEVAMKQNLLTLAQNVLHNIPGLPKPCDMLSTPNGHKKQPVDPLSAMRGPTPCLLNNRAECNASPMDVAPTACSAHRPLCNRVKGTSLEATSAVDSIKQDRPCGSKVFRHPVLSRRLRGYCVDSHFLSALQSIDIDYRLVPPATLSSCSSPKVLQFDPPRLAPVLEQHYLCLLKNPSSVPNIRLSQKGFKLERGLPVNPRALNQTMPGSLSQRARIRQLHLPPGFSVMRLATKRGRRQLQERLREQQLKKGYLQWSMQKHRLLEMLQPSKPEPQHDASKTPAGGTP